MMTPLNFIERFRRILIVAVVLNLSVISLSNAQPISEIARIEVDLSETVGELTPIWSYVGYDEANYTYLPDGRGLLTDLANLSESPVYVRAHNMLNSHEGSPIALKWGSSGVYEEDEDGNPVYDWDMIDRIVDTWVERGMKPVMEIGFMPEDLTTHDGPYRHYWQPGDPYGDIYTGWAYPPNDYEKWSELIYQWVRHSVERYGQEEVESWWWEVWNEPNISYWQGTREEYFELYDYAAHGLKRALPTARIGGPNTAGATGSAGGFLRDFLEHARSGTNYATGETGSPVDFFGFHAKGSPQVTNDGYVRMGMDNQLRQIDSGFEILASFPEFRDIPVILGESDPEGCAACGLNFGYPEMEYRNGTMFSSYTASSFAKKFELADLHNTNFHGAISWTFIFPGQPYFSGFRSFSTTDNINKPVLNVLRMFGMMGGDRVAVTSDNPYTARRVIEDDVRAEPDINGMASLDDRTASVIVWNYHDDHLPAPSGNIQLVIDDIPAERVKMHHYRIDEDHSNAYTFWQEMGAPQQMTREQLADVKDAGQLELFTSPGWVNIENGTAEIEFELPRHGVSLIQLTW